MGSSPLATGGTQDPLLPRLLHEIRHATEIDLAVAFVLSSGLDLVFQALSEALVERQVRLRILTSDYLGVTDPRALRRLLLLAERGAEIKVFEVAHSSFHAKAYIFLRRRVGGRVEGSAYIGSSNLSRSALLGGIEWNWRVRSETVPCGGMDADVPANAGPSSDSTLSASSDLALIRSAFEELFAAPQTRELTYPWIEAYEEGRALAGPERAEPRAPPPVPPELSGAMEILEGPPPPPEPYDIQEEALRALEASRGAGKRRGLVVMATGLGKTWLAAFDVARMGVKRLLYVAHREEILLQAEDTFQTILPTARIGRYDGSTRDAHADFVFASVQTLSRAEHLRRFPPGSFDYVIVDEFHHAAAPTYRRLLHHFRPGFLLGLTATPDRTDQSDILSLCDDNLVFVADLFTGIERGFLAPFSYWGIADESVDYAEIPWRNGRFDPESLSNKLATLARARHVLREWQERRGERTLAFCVSRRHADFMAWQFQREGLRAVSVHGGTTSEEKMAPGLHLGRAEALERLAAGELDVVFSVDLFNEGVDVPNIDTVLMLRPTESRILFLQQLGRGLRKAEGKTSLTVLDFIGNHHAFLTKPQALFGIGSTFRELSELGQRLAQGEMNLPPGCFVNFDLEFIDFLKSLAPEGLSEEYRRVQAALGRRPSAAEFFRAGAPFQRIRREYGNWWKLLAAHDDLSEEEAAVLAEAEPFLEEVEGTSMTRSFKMVLLQTLLENDGLAEAPTPRELSRWALEYFQRRPELTGDLAESVRDVHRIDEAEWHRYWMRNPINAWTGGNRPAEAASWFTIREGRFRPTFPIPEVDGGVLDAMLQELVEYRLASYAARSGAAGRLTEQAVEASNASPGETQRQRWFDLPFFPDLPVACGHFREGRTAPDDLRRVPRRYGEMDPARHFLAHARGRSMDGGEDPIQDGDLLLMELTPTSSLRELVGETLVLERPSSASTGEYLLRDAEPGPSGALVLRARNEAYGDMELEPGVRAVARLKAVVDPVELHVGTEFMREDIPGLFGAEFNPGNWHAGHVVLRNPTRHVILATLTKQGREAKYRYVDHFLDDGRFEWQTQNRTTPKSAWGQELIHHEARGIPVYLFVREHRLRDGKAAPFTFHGRVFLDEHRGSGPMTIVWRFR